MEETRRTAVRDICDVSVAPASKSAVNRILEGYELALLEAVRVTVEDLDVWTNDWKPRTAQELKDDLLSALDESISSKDV